MPNLSSSLLVLVLLSVALAVSWHGVEAGEADSTCNLLEACRNPSSCPTLHEAPPAEFDVTFTTTQGPFTVHVTSAWGPPYAQRLWALARLGYFNGGPFFRVLHQTAPVARSFVAQFGYSGNASVDQCWENELTSNATWPVHKPGNVRGSVTFAMGAVANSGHISNCSSTAPYCVKGFSTNIFVNLQDNSANLDPPGFAPIGTVDAAGMAVVDRLYAGYGEVVGLCPAGAQDPFCVGTGASCNGVNTTTLLLQGNSYVRSQKPKLDKVITVHATT